MAIEFYNTTRAFLLRKAAANRVENLDRYYRLTDTLLPWYQNFEGDEISRCFAQLAFHAQNATMISNIVKFEEKFDFLYEACCHFNPTGFVDRYCPNGSSFDDQISSIVEVLRYNEQNNPNGLRWDSSKSKEENKDSIAKRYAKALINGAKYLKNFHSKQELINDLVCHRTPSVYRRVVDINKDLIKYFMEKMGSGSGFSIALTCDFLKELDECFDFLAKPDVHIMDVMATYLRKPSKEYYYYTEAKARECLRDFQALVVDINLELPEAERITVYQLDRMIWLICSGNFFLDNTGLSKKNYLEAIVNNQDN